MQISNSNQIISKFKDLLKGATLKSKLLSDKFFSVLNEIPELISFINEDNKHNTKLILEELSQNMEIREYKTGEYIRTILGKNDDFYMVLSGSVSELEIKYITTIMTFKEYVLFLTKLYLLKENYLYNDCLEKNNEIFPFHTFKNYIKSFTNKKENEKNNLDEHHHNKKDINIISICNDINRKDFNFKEELKILKRNIKKSNWHKRKKNSLEENQNIDSNIAISYFLELYNFNIENNNTYTTNETKYTVCIPYFVNKKILNPISFIGDLKKPQKMKNYKGYICLSDCFIIYLDKKILKPYHFIYKLSNMKKNSKTIDNLFKNHFLFKNIDIEYLNNNFGKYLEMTLLKKNDILFKQNEPNKGIYIILKGLFQLTTIQSFNELNNLNFVLLHCLDNFPQYVTNIKSEQINNKTNNNNGYYDYNSKSNTVMKDPLFAEKAKEKNEIFFCVYGANDILGLGEIYDSKNKINIFTAKCISDNAELFFLPNEIFSGLIANDNIYYKCGIFIEEKINIFTRCISKYKIIFENKIEYLINNNFNNNNNIYNKNIKKNSRLCFSGKNKSYKSFNTIINNIRNNSNNMMYKSTSDFNSFKNKNIKIKINKEENDKNNVNKKQNKFNMYENLNKDKNYISRINSFIKEPEEKKNYIDNNYKSQKIFLPSNKNNNVYNFMDVTIPKLEKKKLLKDNNKYYNNNPLFLGNKKMKNLLLKSSSFENDDAGIKKRMEEISRYYSGNNNKRNSGPILISSVINNSLNNINDIKIKNNTNNNIIKNEEGKLNVKLNKDIINKMKGRCLSAKRYDKPKSNKRIHHTNNNNALKTVEYLKKNEEINKFYDNIRAFSGKKKSIFSITKNFDNKSKKITINKFSPTSLFPAIDNNNEK